MDNRKYVRILLNILIPILTVYAVCVWGFRLLLFFFPFVFGWVIAMIANPPVRFLEQKRKIVRKHSSAVLIVSVLALIVFVFYLLGAWCARELSDFVHDLPELYETAREEIVRAGQGVRGLLGFVPAGIENSITQMSEDISASIADYFQSMASSAGGAVVRTIPEFFVNTVVTLISAYLFLAEHDRIAAAIHSHMPTPVKHYWELFRMDLRVMIGGYFLAQFKIMFVVALILLAGFWILRVRYGVFLAVGIAFLDFLPMFGTGTALFPWAVVKLFGGEYYYAFGLVMLYVVTQAVRQIVQPKIVGDSLGLPPLTTLFFLYLGFRFRGIAGMILAVPVGLVVIKCYEYGMFDSFFENCRLLVEEVQRVRKGEE